MAQKSWKEKIKPKQVQEVKFGEMDTKEERRIEAGCLDPK